MAWSDVAKPPSISRTKQAALPGLLLAWYDRHRRQLPWRARPGETPDPYRVWLSEIMLQQTTVVVVAPYYAAFLRRWPDVKALAASSLDAVLHGWQGLGYYARARNLLACAGVVARDFGGRFPDSEAGLRELPGIGAYTAAAIAAIAFGRRASALDGNGERVMARIGRGASAGGAVGRLRPSADGFGRHHLHAAQAEMRAVPLARALRGAEARHSGAIAGAGGEEGKAATLRRRLLGGR